MALKQKMREEKKKMDEARTRAAQKGPMGKCIAERYLPIDSFFAEGGSGGIKKSGKK